MKVLSALFLAAFLSVNSAGASSAVFTNGSDWTNRMSPGEKYLSLMAPMAVFSQYGVPFRYTLEEYIPRIDKVLAHNPQLGGEDVTNIFASAVYRFEPESRPAFDAIEAEFLRGNYSLPLRLDVVPVPTD